MVRLVCPAVCLLSKSPLQQQIHPHALCPKTLAPQQQLASVLRHTAALNSCCVTLTEP